MITSIDIRMVSDSSYLLTWTSDVADAVFRVFRDGVQIATTSASSLLVTIAAGEYPRFDVFDDDTSQPAASFPNRMLLAFYAVSGAASYRIEEYVSGNWVTRATITDRGQGYFIWESRVLEDVTIHQFRITAIAANGLESTAAQKSALMVRIPDPPLAKWTYVNGSLTPTVTVA